MSYPDERVTDLTRAEFVDASDLIRRISHYVPITDCYRLSVEGFDAIAAFLHDVHPRWERHPRMFGKRVIVHDPEAVSA